tara:strand:+ start:145 stop:402 length:258 start_codon:yes stop_codon:yes gene_type:complete
MKITIEYEPTNENMDYVFELEIDIIQRLSALDSLHLLGIDRVPETVKKAEDIFEIKADGETIFDKETLGRLPNGEEVVDYIINNS